MVWRSKQPECRSKATAEHYSFSSPQQRNASPRPQYEAVASIPLYRASLSCAQACGRAVGFVSSALRSELLGYDHLVAPRPQAWPARSLAAARKWGSDWSWQLAGGAVGGHWAVVKTDLVTGQRSIVKVKSRSLGQQRPSG